MHTDLVICYSFLHRFHNRCNQKVADFLLDQVKDQKGQKYNEENIINIMFNEHSVTVLLLEAVHQYYDSRRRSYNDSQPGRYHVKKQRQRQQSVC